MKNIGKHNFGHPTLLQLLPELESGGVERGTIDIAKAAKRAGLTSIVASNGGKMVSQLENAGIKHCQMNLATKNPLAIFSNKFKLKKLIDDRRINILHARSRAPAWSGYMAALEADIPFITTFHGTYSIGNALKKRYNSVMTKGDVVIAISNFIADHIISNYEIDEQKIKIVPRGVDLSFFSNQNISQNRLLIMAEKLGIPDGLPVIMLPGRITRWKGQKILLEALALLPHRDFFCLLIGDSKKNSSYLKEITAYIKNTKLLGHVRILSACSDIPAAYALSDIVISASTKPEAFGRVAAEAQAMEKIIIATHHGGSLETVLDERTGFLTPPADIYALSEKIDYALKLSGEARKMITSSARKHIEDNFSLDAMCNATLEIYKSF